MIFYSDNEDVIFQINNRMIFYSNNGDIIFQTNNGYDILQLPNIRTEPKRIHDYPHQKIILD
jgi:hypothetical protein